MAQIISLDQIKSVLHKVDAIEAMKTGFISYSNGLCVVPPVGELIFENPPGDVHIKYGYIKNDHYYVIKIASGFYENHKYGVTSGQGMMLLFDQKTGQLKVVLLDEGHLTDIRTAAAGGLVAQYFAPEKVNGIGIVGTGVQARLQLEYIHKVATCDEIWVWGRNVEKAMKMKSELDQKFNIQVAEDIEQLAEKCNLIVTTTPSESPLLKESHIKKGSLIIAMGSDTQHKQEVESSILNRADIVISDSIPQSKSRGEIFKAVESKAISPEKVIEVGEALQDQKKRRTSDDQIIVVDLTGVAVQDIMITSAIYDLLKE